jgi:RsiW-degrading membrane proteinase PrsW (M82 family)
MEKKKVANNLDVMKNPFTTILGIVCIIFAFIIYAISLLVATKEPVQWYVYTCLLALGLVLVLIPDDFISALKNVLSSISNLAKRKSDSL